MPTQLHGFFHPRGEERKKKEGSAFSLAKRCIIENHLECDYLQPPSNAVHLAPLTWWITSFYDGNGSLRRAGIKGGERTAITSRLRRDNRSCPRGKLDEKWFLENLGKGDILVRSRFFK